MYDDYLDRPAGTKSEDPTYRAIVASAAQPVSKLGRLPPLGRGRLSP